MEEEDRGLAVLRVCAAGREIEAPPQQPQALAQTQASLLLLLQSLLPDNCLTSDLI